MNVNFFLILDYDSIWYNKWFVCSVTNGSERDLNHNALRFKSNDLFIEVFLQVQNLS